MDLQNILQQAKAGLPGAQPQGAPVAPKRSIPAGLAKYEAEKKAGTLPPKVAVAPQGQPDPQVLATLAQVASSLDPQALGMILFNALNQAHLPLNAQGLTQLEGPTAKPQVTPASPMVGL
jgi:hypothetical protein